MVFFRRSAVCIEGIIDLWMPAAAIRGTATQFLTPTTETTLTLVGGTLEYYNLKEEQDFKLDISDLTDALKSGSISPKKISFCFQGTANGYITHSIKE